MDSRALKVRNEKVKVVRDTVYVERRDSVFVSETKKADETQSGSGFRATLKWIFAILCAMIVLVIVIRTGLRKSLL